uniref:C-methyltransferase domain-containing protein n=1 Tax=viral metagenome TaxID=1070528 RepID=A0A6C0BAW4_9ZZZZ
MRNCPICGKLSENLTHIVNINLSLVDDSILNNKLSVKYCNNCTFYFSDSENTQEDYNNYYMTFNNYQQQNYCEDKDLKCRDFICNNINKDQVKTIIDYGAGNGVLANLLQKDFIVETFDIGMEQTDIKYDCLILSHVLEHIYDLDSFINEVSKNIKEDGLLYIEIPNAEFYEEFINICPLQEVNIEHINFFSKYALNKLLINNGFYSINLQDDYFMLKDMKYHVIRGLFKKNNNNKSFEKYLNHGINEIESFKFSNLKQYEKIYVYGCGQFLFKILDKIQENCNIINIIDDNSCYLNKKIKNIEIINYDLFKEKCKDGDTILLTTLIHDEKIKNRLALIDKKINIIDALFSLE